MVKQLVGKTIEHQSIGCVTIHKQMPEGLTSAQQSQWRYRHSDKGMSSNVRYNNSEKGKARDRKYKENNRILLTEKQKDRQHHNNNLSQKKWRLKNGK
jgi:hypothetical protein